MSGLHPRRDRPVRLLVQGFSGSVSDETPLPAPQLLTSALQNQEAALRYTVVAEMEKYLRDRNVDVASALNNLRLPSHHPWRRMPSLHLLETEGAEASRVIRDLYRVFGDANRPEQFIELIEFEPALQSLASLTPTRLGSGFMLNAPGCSHAAYRRDIGADAAAGHGVFGGKAIVAVLDSGADAGQTLAGWNDFTVLKSPSARDSIGHGAAMVAIVADIAPQAEVHALRVTDSGAVLLWDLIAAIDAATFVVGAHIINMSLGLPNLQFNCTRCGGGQSGNRSAVFQTRFDRLEAGAGVAGAHDPIFVAAVGNDGLANGYHWPAAFPNDNLIAAGAVTHSLNRSGFSNTGSTKKHYFLCPGGEIDAAGTIVEWVGEGSDNGVVTKCVGTSPAAAYAAGLLALHRHDLQLRGKDFDRAAIVDSVTIAAASDVTNENGAVRLVI